MSGGLKRSKRTCWQAAGSSWVRVGLLISCILCLESTLGSAAILATDCVVRDSRVVVRWQSPLDLRLAGFYLERLDAKTGVFIRVTPDLVESSTSFDALTWYEAVDGAALPGQSLTYRVVEVRMEGTQVFDASFTGVPRAETHRAMSVAAPSPDPIVRVASGIQAVPGAHVKILTERLGIHAVSAETLASNLDGSTTETMVQSIASGGLRMTCGTNEIAWTPAPGNTGILFYATAIDSIYTRQNVYWVEPGAGVTMNVQTSPVPAAPVEGLTFTEVLHIEDDRKANNLIFSDPEADIWYWARVIVNTSKTTSTNYLMNLPGAQAGDGWLKVELKGSSTLPSTPPHHARISLNGQLLGAVDWGGYGVSAVSFPATNWLAGTNSVKVEGYSQPGESDGATFYIDSFEASYRKYYLAYSNSLSCSAETNEVITVGGFTRTDIQVFDVTDTLHPIKLNGDSVLIDSPGTGEWRVTFPAGSPDRRFWVMAGDPMTPVKVVGRPVAQWSTPAHESDHLVIFHDSLKTGAQSLVAYRCAMGLASLGVDVEDVYDEFSQGIVTPHAIRSFLRYARLNWVKAPAMVVLAGAGNWDYKNNLNMTIDPCLIPPVMVNTPEGLVGVDMPLGDTDGDGVPDVVIGRLSVLTTNQMTEAVRKIKAVEAVVGMVTNVSFVADANDPDLGPEWGNFSGNSDVLASYVSSPYAKDYNYGFSGTNMAGVRARFVEQLNLPRALVAYLGHGNENVLGKNWDVLTTADVTRLTNSVPPVLFGLTCFFGGFASPAVDGFAEQLVRKSSGGVVAVWSCSAPSQSGDNTKLGSLMMRSCFRKNRIRLGEAMKEAMVAYAREGTYRPWVLQTYSLLGDPALDLGLRNGEPATYEEWRRFVFTAEQQADPLTSDPDADPDQDGVPNQDEYGAGTLPMNSDSRLWINAIAAANPEGCSIHWPSVSNRLYAVQWTTNLMEGFKTMADYIWAAPPENIYTDGLESGAGTIFYRVKLMDVP